MLINQIISKAKLLKKRIAFDETDDLRILKAANEIRNQDIAFPVLIGNKSEIFKIAKENNINLSDIEIIDPEEFENTNQLITNLFEIRKEKGMTLEKSKNLIQSDKLYLTTMLLHQGFIDGIISGATKTTADTIRPALQIIKTKKDISLVSSCFLMIKENKSLVFADCALNINPNSKQLSDIAISTYETAKFLGISEPKMAMLSFSTKGSAKHDFVDKITNATKLVNEKRKDIIIDGELQFDAAYVPSVADSKCPNSIIKGNANIFIFPDLNSGNTGYKIAQRLGNYKAIGPILQGLKKPVNDLSRGCNVEDIVKLTAITSLMADNN